MVTAGAGPGGWEGGWLGPYLAPGTMERSWTFILRERQAVGVTSGEKPPVPRCGAEGKARGVDRGSAGQTRLPMQVWAQPWRPLLELEFTGPRMDSQEGEAGAPGLLPAAGC